MRISKPNINISKKKENISRQSGEAGNVTHGNLEPPTSETEVTSPRIMHVALLPYVFPLDMRKP